MEYQFITWAIMLGALSAASLPLGSALGLIWQPTNKTTGLLTAFGGGALIAALSVELVAPTAMQILDARDAAEHLEASSHLINMLVGAMFGGILFIGLDQIINSKGGFLRKNSSTISYFRSKRNKRRRQIITMLGNSELIRHLPINLIEEAVKNIKEKHLVAGDRVFSEGDPGNIVYFIESGSVAITRSENKIATLNVGDIMGEISILTDASRTATATAETDIKLLLMGKEDFDHWRDLSPEFNKEAQTLVTARLEELASRENSTSSTQGWLDTATSSLTETIALPTDNELREVSKEHGGAPMAIWLGILLDGIPESFVIGSALAASIAAIVAHSGPDSVHLGQIVPYTLIIGLFLANFPEALSSSIGMLKQGWGRTRVFMMWSSLLIMTAVGAGLGYWLGGSVGHNIVVIIEGLAAGAMLTMIAAAMIPEAVHLGGSNITGVGTLTGFLSAVAFKLLE